MRFTVCIVHVPFNDNKLTGQYSISHINDCEIPFRGMLKPLWFNLCSKINNVSIQIGTLKVPNFVYFGPHFSGKLRQSINRKNLRFCSLPSFKIQFQHLTMQTNFGHTVSPSYSLRSLLVYFYQIQCLFQSDFICFSIRSLAILKIHREICQLTISTSCLFYVQEHLHITFSQLIKNIYNYLRTPECCSNQTMNIVVHMRKSIS